MDPVGHYDYVLTMVDSLTRFVKFVPCNKNITGEGTFKLILEHWIQHYDKPVTIMHDNDVRFSQSKGLWRALFRRMGVNVRFSIPRHPARNGLCERVHMHLGRLRPGSDVAQCIGGYIGSNHRRLCMGL